MQAIAIVPKLHEQEAQAKYYYQQAQENIKLFIETVNEIQDAGEWKSEYSNWNEYCKRNLPVGAARISQMKKADIINDMIQELNGLTPIKAEVEMMRKAIPYADLDMIPNLYQIVHQLIKDEPIAQRHYKAAHGVEKGRLHTGAVNVNGESINLYEMAKLAEHQEAIMEANQRFKQYKLGNRQSIAFIATQRANGDYTIRSESDLPEEFEAKLWVEKDNDE